MTINMYKCILISLFIISKYKHTKHKAQSTKHKAHTKIMKFTGKLFSYQKEAMMWMLKRESSHRAPGGFLCLDPGMGKTILTMVTIAVHDLDHTLIVVPKNIMSQWVSEFAKFTDCTPLVVDARMNNKKEITHEMLKEHKVCITSISTFSSMIDTDDCALLSFKFDRLVIDEGHLIRNRRSKSFWAMNQIKSHIRWILTGTLINKNRNDFKSLLEFMDIFNVNLTQAAREFVYRRTKEDVGLSIPDLHIEEIRGDFETDAEKDLYAELVENGKILLRAYNAYGDGEGRMRLLEQLMRMRQCVTNPQILYANSEDEKWEGNRTKLNMLRKEIQNNPVEKTLIFCNWICEMDAIREMLHSIGHKSVTLNGKTPNSQRDVNIKSFNEDNNINFFIIQIESGGIGLNLQVATRVFINSLSWNATTEIQAIARAHRIGQTANVIVKRLIIDNTFDEHVLNLQQKKLEIASEIFDDKRIEKSLQQTRKQKNSTFKQLTNVFK
ncbi:ATP-dependent helicase [Paramecium bursaria Chlorella virus CviKI]|nr:ATP-dependent helicase [Paramecium bursaria Chlorella virus CviKI]